jgi:glycosyltransferase involved in cell wall biosynthesis
MNNKLLSICIPTYNRCDILDETLNKLFNNPDFVNENIEVIVSDNCSTDRTKEIIAKYPLVKYYRNQENTSFFNLTTVLSYATGKYIKLYNDTFNFHPNALGIMLSRIKMHEDKNINLFFYPNFLNNKNNVKVINSISLFFKECSYNTTWTAAIGFWKNDFDKIENKNRYASHHLPQLDWMYNIVKNGKETIVYFEDLFEVISPNKKGGYNIFKTFVTDYLNIIKKEDIGFITFEIEKYRLFRYFVYPWLITLLITEKNNYIFDLKNSFNIILKKYWYEPYFLPILLLFWFKKLRR